MHNEKSWRKIDEIAFPTSPEKSVILGGSRHKPSLLGNDGEYRGIASSLRSSQRRGRDVVATKGWLCHEEFPGQAESGRG